MSNLVSKEELREAINLTYMAIKEILEISLPFGKQNIEISEFYLSAEVFRTNRINAKTYIRALIDSNYTPSSIAFAVDTVKWQFEMPFSMASRSLEESMSYINVNQALCTLLMSIKAMTKGMMEENLKYIKNRKPETPVEEVKTPSTSPACVYDYP